MKDQDLQISAVTASGGATKSFSMAHKMGLAEIELKTATYYAIVEANNGTSTITRTTDTNEEVTASSNFDSTSPYYIPVQKGSTKLYYAVVKTGTNSTEFNSQAGTDQWADAVIATDISAGAIGHYDVYSTRVGTSTYSGSFSYSGSYLTFTVPFSGTYTIECWGASGGSPNEYNSNGAYTSGTIVLTANQELYIYIGEKGDDGHTGATPTASYNGGGYGIKSSHSNGLTSSSGGGATDIRLTIGNLYSRIMVAAGGGGGSGNSSNGGAGGGLNGYGTPSNGGSSGSLEGCTGASQLSGGKTSSKRISGSITWTMGTNGSFGSGGNGGSSNNINCGGGGGGGYWGGAGGGSGNVGMAGASGSGGSSYISGHAGCVAIMSSSSTSPSTAGTDNSIARSTHYSGKKFSPTKMIDGRGFGWTTLVGAAETMPTPPGGTVNYGNVGHGYCRITGISATQ